MILRFICLLPLAATPVLASGFQFVEIPATAPQPPIEAAVWFPTDAPILGAPNTPFGQALVHGAPVAFLAVQPSDGD